MGDVNILRQCFTFPFEETVALFRSLQFALHQAQRLSGWENRFAVLEESASVLRIYHSAYGLRNEPTYRNSCHFGFNVMREPRKTVTRGRI